MRVHNLTDLPAGRIVYYTYEDLDAGRIPDGAVYFEQLCEDENGNAKRYKAGGVLAVLT